MLLVVNCGNAHAQVPSNAFDYTRTSSFAYSATTGLLTGETVEPDNAQSCVVTSYVLDGYGNRQSATVANCAGATGRAVFSSRSTSTVFGAAGQTVTVNGVSVVVPQGAFATTVTNSLSQSETRTYDPRFGAALSIIGPNGLATTWQLDDWGRKVLEIRADGTRTAMRYCILPGIGLDTSTNSAGCPTSTPTEAPATVAVQFVHSELQNSAGVKIGAFSRVYSDRLGRTVRTATESFDAGTQPSAPGTLIVQDTAYNAYGAKEVQSQPYFLATGASITSGSNTRGASRTDYDVLGRPVTLYVADPGGSTTNVSFSGVGTRTAAKTTITYNGLTVTTTNDKGQTQKQEKNPNGKVVRVTDALGAQLVHQYDAFDNLIATKDALGNQTSLVYDLRGRKTQLTDPDTGLWKYDYNALGELVWQESPNQRALAQTTTMGYDVLGRMTTRTEPEYVTTWTYDKYANNSACTKGIGKLCEVSTSNGVNRKMVYDSLGRPLSSRTTITGGPSMATAVTYDAATGRLSTQTYPTGLKVSYAYTSKGFLQQLSLVTATTGTVALAANTILWQARVMNAWGQLEQQSTSNNVVTQAGMQAATGRLSTLLAGIGGNNTVVNQAYNWDSLGNLSGRTDSIGDAASSGAVNETFLYDSLNRLKQYTVSSALVGNNGGVGSRSVDLQYNAIGSLLYKSDVGAYSYPASGASSVRPHAVASVSGATTISYTYDNNGNLKTASGGKYTSVAYTSFNLPDGQSGVLGNGGTTRTVWQYDENHARIKELRTISSGTQAGTRTTWYLHPDNAGGLGFESEENVPSAPTAANPNAVGNRHYLSVGGASIGVLVSTGALPTLAAGATTPPTITTIILAKVEYWHKDHLGSLIASTDHAGAVTARMAYDPFGKRRTTGGVYDRNGNLVVDYNPGTNSGTDRGFTGHEHLDELGLIHMNGRIYDPTLGVFLQADPIIQAPLNLLSYNRYLYGWANPLNGTDPTGFCFMGCFWHGSNIAKAWHSLYRNEAFRIALAIAAAVYAPELLGQLIGTEVTGVYAAATGGFASGAVSSGNLKGALQGMGTAIVFFGVGEFIPSGVDKTGTILDPNKFVGAVAAHAVAGCVTSSAFGGKCGSGALSAAFSKAATPITGPLGESNIFLGGVASAVVGGTASKLGGGKFSSGAMTGAFSYLFNDRLHQNREDGWDAPNGKGPNDRGLDAENLVRADLESRGYKFVDRQVMLESGERIYDLLMRGPDTRLFAVESKSTITGFFTDNPRQVALDVDLLRNGATLVSPSGATYVVRNLIYQGVDFSSNLGAGLASWRTATIIRQYGGDVSIQRVGPKQ